MRIFMSSFFISVIIFFTVFFMAITENVCTKNLTGENIETFSIDITKSKINISINFMGIEKTFEFG